MASVKWVESPSRLDDSWRSTAEKVLADIPSTWTYNGVTYNVTVQINFIRNGKHVTRSMHYRGLAIDANIILNGTLIRTGNYGEAKKTDKFQVGNKYVLVYDVYSQLLGASASANGCTWGGNFSTYDPMHFDSGASSVGGRGTRIAGSDIIVVYDELGSEQATTALETGAGYDSKMESGSPLVQPQNTTVFIGYDLTLSDFSNIYGDTPLKELLIASGVSAETTNALVKFNGLKGEAAYELYQKNKQIEITEDNASTILGSRVSSITRFLENEKGINLKSYPREISTAIASYLLGKNLAAVQNVEDITEIQKILKNVDYSIVATELARFIESRSAGLKPDIKSRRDREAQLLRGYNPNASTQNNSITSSTSQSDYEGEADRLDAQLNDQIDEIKNLLNSRKISSSDPASKEYDDSFNDIDQATLDAIASIMQSQQVNSDLYFGYKEREYIYRVKTKNFYTILSRKLNYKISAIEKLVQSEPLLKNHQEYSLNQMYSMIPYSSGLGHTVKKNAIKRCEFRIRQIEQRIRNNESSLISFGLPSTGSYAENSVFIATLPLTLGAAGAALIINSVQEFFGTLAVLREQLKLERGNLAQLKKDANRYS